MPNLETGSDPVMQLIIFYSAAVQPASEVQGYKVFLDVRSIFGGSQSCPAILGWLQPGCKVSPLVRSIFFEQNADLTSGLYCNQLIIILFLTTNGFPE